MKFTKYSNFKLVMITASVLFSAYTPTFGNDKIQRAKTLPSTTPWNLEELSKAPAFEWSKDTKIQGKTVRSLFYKGEPYMGKDTRVFAYYATPGIISGDKSKDKNLPAIVLVHGGGGKAFPYWAKIWASRGYAAIAMDLGGCGPGKKRLSDGGPNLKHHDIFGMMDKPITDQWSYHAVANVIRAHSLIRSFPEVDSNRTAITGISWGGYLTCIVAGLDNRFKAAAPVYGCGYLHEASFWLKTFAKMSANHRTTWIKLWDPSQYVGSATMPMLFANGGKDFAYYPRSHAKTYELVKSPKKLHFVPNLPHGHIFHRPRAILVFIDHNLKKGIPLAKVSTPVIKGKIVTATVESQTKLINAEMNYTLDSLSGVNPKKRKWLKKKAIINGNKIIADLPPQNATIWFLTVKDKRNTTVSSNLTFPKIDESSCLNTFIPESKDFKVVYIMDPSNPKTTNGGKTMVYSTNKKSEIIGDIDKIAYALVLNNKDYVFVSMDPFTKDLNKIGVPTAATKAVFQQKLKNLFVKSNVKGVKNGEFADGGNIEFWGSNYSFKNAAKVPGASNSKYDFGDQRGGGLLGHGSMQIHNSKAKQTLFAFNNFRGGKRASIGIGNNPKGHPDWTFARNVGKYKSAKLYVMVKTKQ